MTINNSIHKIDISNEFILERYHNGIKLVKENNHYNLDKPNLILGNFMKLPMNIFFNNKQIAYTFANDVTTENCGYNSVKDMLGKSPLDYYKRDFAVPIVLQHNKVLSNNQMMFVEQDTMTIKDELLVHYLTVLFPWYNQDNEIVGTFGCGILLGTHSLSESLFSLFSLGLLNSQNLATNTQFTNIPNHIHFSKREKECINLLLAGKKTSEMADMLSLSKRTVEYYIENIKCKLNVTSKTDLILKIKGFI